MSAFAGLVVGLGNPGQKYAGTRHNLGFMFVDELLAAAERAGRVVSSLSGDKFQCQLWRTTLADNASWLVAKPLTFMNLSGACVQPLAAWHKISPENIVVIHDELDLPPGRMRFKIGGSNAGHNGLTSITERLGTPDFYRLRLGIGRPPRDPGNVVNWVLGGFSKDEAEAVCGMMPAALDVLNDFVLDGPAKAIRSANAYNKPDKKKPAVE